MTEVISQILERQGRVKKKTLNPTSMSSWVSAGLLINSHIANIKKQTVNFVLWKDLPYLLFIWCLKTKIIVRPFEKGIYHISAAKAQESLDIHAVSSTHNKLNWSKFQKKSQRSCPNGWDHNPHVTKVCHDKQSPCPHPAHAASIADPYLATVTEIDNVTCVLINS